MKKIYLILGILLLINLVTADFGFGIAPSSKHLAITPNQGTQVTFMVSNGGDSEIQVSLSTNNENVVPNQDTVTVEPKKDTAVAFRILPLPAGNYSVKITGMATSPSGEGMGLSVKSQATLYLLVGHPAKQIENSGEIVCGDGICQPPFEAHSNCPADCQGKEGFNPLKYLINLINFIKKII